MIDTLDSLCLASVSDEGVGSYQAPAACINDEVFSHAIRALIAAYSVKCGNALSNGELKVSLRWRDGELTGIRFKDDVFITKDGIKNSGDRARELSKQPD